MASVGSVDPLNRLFEGVLDDVRPLRSGAPADYIPELAAADTEPLGLAAVGPAGRVVTVGDAAAEFTIQSISKPFVLALALEQLGREPVLRRVGVEPSGEPFNAISLEADSGRPANPLVNAGAIATTGLIEGPHAEARSGRIVEILSRFAARDLGVDERVYESESATGHRNRALAHLMTSYGVLDNPVPDVVEAYFRQCSVVVTVRDLAVMSATLAFNGRNPLSGEQVVSPGTARDVLSIMSSCGMYDYSGEWMLRVGLAAKSGVSGGVVAISPSQFGIGVFSPRLDTHGNSVRGVAALERISNGFGVHIFDAHESLAFPVVTVTRTGASRVVHVAGELSLSGAMHVLAQLRQLLDAADDDESVSLDVRRLQSAHPMALTALTEEIESLGDRVALVR